MDTDSELENSQSFRVGEGKSVHSKHEGYNIRRM